MADIRVDFYSFVRDGTIISKNDGLHLRRDAALHRIGEFAELPLHRHLLTRDRGRDAIRELDGGLTDPRRTSSPCVRVTFPSHRAPRLRSRYGRCQATPTVAVPKYRWSCPLYSVAQNPIGVHNPATSEQQDLFPRHPSDYRQRQVGFSANGSSPPSSCNGQEHESP